MLLFISVQPHLSFSIMILKYILLGLFFTGRLASMNPRIIELNDKFLEIKREGYWLIMFYAPWCAYCKRLDPVWSHVQQALQTTGIRVCRLDCIAHKHACRQYGIDNFPTIIFVKGDEEQHVYNGDREVTEIVNFALRVAHPPVRSFHEPQLLERLKNENMIFFTYVGNAQGPLWEHYHYMAHKFRPHVFFFHALPDFAEKHLKDFKAPSVFVHKERSFISFQPEITDWEKEDTDHLNQTLWRWVNEERFLTFPKVTRMNINLLMETRKYLVLAVVEENKVNDIPIHLAEFKTMVESVIRNNPDRFRKNFQFGWIGSPDLANSIMMQVVPLPSLLVLNSTTFHHHIPDDDAHQLTPEAITIFLDSVLNDSAPKYGGKSLLSAIYRVYFETTNMLVEMWRGNPVLTTVIFGLPSGFLSLICYSICCADILDANDDEDDDDFEHEKKE